MSDPSGSIAFGYDARGRLVQKTSTINSINYPLTYVYTPGGRLDSVTYPSNRSITYDRDALGKISEVTASGIQTPLATGVTYRPFGGPLGMTKAFSSCEAGMRSPGLLIHIDITRKWCAQNKTKPMLSFQIQRLLQMKSQ